MAAADASPVLHRRPAGGPKRAAALCRFHARNKCTLGEACPFAHSIGELAMVPDTFFTKLCRQVARGSVCKNPVCTFSHSRRDVKAARDGRRARTIEGDSSAESDAGGSVLAAEQQDSDENKGYRNKGGPQVSCKFAWIYTPFY